MGRRFLHAARLRRVRRRRDVALLVRRGTRPRRALHRAIPIFPLRDPILAFAYTRTDSPITQPSDLRGKRIGVDGYRYTVNLWLRGLFKEHYGFSPEEAIWVTGEPEGNGYIVPKNITVELRKGKTPAAPGRKPTARP